MINSKLDISQFHFRPLFITIQSSSLNLSFKHPWLFLISNMVIQSVVKDITMAKISIFTIKFSAKFLVSPSHLNLKFQIYTSK